MVHGLSLATITGRWLGETPFVQVSTTWALTRPETVYQRPRMTREIETWLSDSRVSNNSVVDHRSQELSRQMSCLTILGVVMQAVEVDAQRHQHTQANLDGLQWFEAYCQLLLYNVSTSADWSDFIVSSPILSTHLGIWACGSTWRRHTSKHGSSAPHQRITQPTSWPHVASPTWSYTEQVARPATKRLHASDWRPLEACCRPWTWWCNDATALAGYTNLMMMMIDTTRLSS